MSGTWGSARAGSAEHKRWARAVKQRDGYQCQECGYQGTPGKGDVEADHITNVAAGGTYDLDNGVTLCRACHAPKSRREGLAARHAKTARGRIPPEPHPGLIP